MLKPMKLELDLLGPRKGAYVLTALLSCVAVMSWIAGLIPHDPSSVPLSDGTTFYCAGQIANAGGNPYNTAQMQACGAGLSTAITPFLHPPLTLPLFQLWALLPYPLAMLLLTLGQIGALSIICPYIWSRCESTALRLTLLPLILTASATTSNLISGQVNLILFALALLAIKATIHNKPARAGGLLMLATLLKPYIGLLFIALANFRLLLTATGILLLAAAATFQLPSQIWHSFAENSLSAATPAADAAMQGFTDMEWVIRNNLSLYGTLRRLGLAAQSAHQIQLICALLMLSTCFYQLWQHRHRLSDSHVRRKLSSLVLPLTVLLPTMSWTTYLLWASPAALALHGRRQWLIVPLVLPFTLTRDYIGPVQLFIPTLALLAIWLSHFSGAGCRTGGR